MPQRIVKHLKVLLEERPWVKGAVNFDEDLHFSSFYLRASWSAHTGTLYPGYTTMVAFYTGFNESYYLQKDECRSTAATIVDRALHRPEWLPGVIAEIHRRSDALAQVFDPETSPPRLARMSDGRLLALYRRHAARQRSLYRVARLPEALDRGVFYFSDYLQDHLRTVGVPAADVGEVFATLSQPLSPSVLAQEILEFDAIVRDAQQRSSRADRLGRCGGRARMFLDPSVLARLDNHRAKWQFLTYHGYGRRELATHGQYLTRLIEQLEQPRSQSEAGELLQRFKASARARQRVLAHLSLDAAHRRLFEIYPDIGVAKLYRRHAQLRNFYYLDMLLAEIAARLGVAEWTLRSMLPEEIEDALQARRPVPAAVRGRVPDCLLAFVQEREHLVGGNAARELCQMFHDRTQSRAEGPVLHGVVASRGHAVGRCKIVIRADDVRMPLAPGTIVVSESTDPDLLGLLRQAVGVLTEQGGVTAHAAIICRELGVPTIIGIDGLLDRVHDGDLVEINALQGTVTLRSEAPAAANGHAAPLGSADVIGAKAHNLGFVRSLGFDVPEFAVVLFNAVRAAIESSEAVAMAARLLAALGLRDDETVAVRSSAIGEDGEAGSLAGEFHSLLHVPAKRLPEGLREFAQHNQVGKSGQPYRGAVIVQRMIAADWAGVCLTQDARTGHGNAVIVEAVAGGNETVTGGTTVPDRFVVDRLTGDLLEAQQRRPQPTDGAMDVAALVRQCLTLEARFGKPLDIEWALAGRKLYILQARPIVKGAR
jgi:phosphohistidine swiveling domain-containing protein